MEISKPIQAEIVVSTNPSRERSKLVLYFGTNHTAPIRKDRYGFDRVQTRVLFIDPKENSPSLESFEEFITRFRVVQGDSKDVEIRKQLILDMLWNKCPKLFAYQSKRTNDNRTISTAKLHAAQHRAIWIRDISTQQLKSNISDDWVDDYITEEDLENWPSLRKWLADPSTQYSDQKSARDGLVTLNTIRMAETLNWDGELLESINADKLSNRMSIMARLDAVNWMDAPPCVDIICMPETVAKEYFGYVPPDGIILCNAAALESFKFENRKGIPEKLAEGTKIRGGYNMPPIKGTLQLIVDPSGTSIPTFYVTEGGSLKTSLPLVDGEPDVEVYSITREEVLSSNAPFYVETPSRERLILNPTLGIHMLNHIVSQQRNINPEQASKLVPQLSDKALQIANFEAPLVEYAWLCVYPYPAYGDPPRNKVEQILQRVIDGEISVLEIKLETEDDTLDNHFQADGNLYCNFGKAMYQTLEMEYPLVFGLTATGRRIVRGGVRLLKAQSVRDELDPHIAKMIRNILARKIRGIGGIAQGNYQLTYKEAYISREMATRIVRNTPRETRKSVRKMLETNNFPVAMMYWPSKFFHCLMQMRIGIKNRISGASIQVNPHVLETLGGDSDGDLIFMITDPTIVASIPDATNEITVEDKVTGESYTYPDTMSMTEKEREIAQRSIDLDSEYLATQNNTSDPYVRFTRICAAAKVIGRSFNARDITVDVTGWDPRVYTRMGQICQEALSGLKMKSGGDIVTWYLNNISHLAGFLNIPQSHLPFLEDVPWWNTRAIIAERKKGKGIKEISHYMLMYKTMTSEVDMNAYLSHASSAKIDASGIFEWMLARTRISEISRGSTITVEKMKSMASILDVSSQDLRDAKFHLRRINAGSFDNERRWHPDDSGAIRPMWNRWMRADMLSHTGIPISAFKKAILLHICAYPVTIENLGLVDLLDIAKAEVSEIVAEVNDLPVTEPCDTTFSDIYLDYVFGDYKSLEDAAEKNNVKLDDLVALRNNDPQDK